MPPTPSYAIRLTDIADAIAAVPSILGFYPTDSLVLVRSDDPSAVVTGAMRCDLPPLDRSVDVTLQVLQAAQETRTFGALTLIVGGPIDTCEEPPYRVLVEHVRELAPTHGVSIEHAVWTPDISHGAEWRCYDDPPCTGVLPDPTASVLAATRALQGFRTYASREEAATLLAPEPPEVLARRARLLPQAADSRSVLLPDRPGAIVRAAIIAARAGRLPTGDREILDVVAALATAAGEAASLAAAVGADSLHTEQLWIALIRATPTPYCASPAVTLAVTAYLRGDGVLAHLALDRAEEADPGRSAVQILRVAFDLGLSPIEFRELIITTLAAAALRRRR